ncbi:MAG: alanyl-tRNA editing protein [Acidimicrobiia bacterium]|nr:alanyl-tRNA editing protein [Acidimicrobiia bacterium]
MTRRLYYGDCYLTHFQASIVEAEANTVYLDQTAFYPTSGGQLHDTGDINGTQVLDVIDQGGRIAHQLASPLAPGPVSCQVDWERRFDFMQQHSGQHLLSAVLQDLYKLPTISVHMGTQFSTMDVTGNLTPEQVRQLEQEANRQVVANRPVTISFHEPQEPVELRKASARAGTLRIVSIEGLDRSACGGTHLRCTGEIGPILIRKLEKIRTETRIEFLCGARAVKRARADFETLSAIARQFSATLEETPQLVATQMERLAESEKARRKLALDAASALGRKLHAETAPNQRGLRVGLLRLNSAIDDETRVQAQAFAGQGAAICFVLSSEPPALLLAASADSGIKAGDTLKSLLQRRGGRGGGNAQMAQGSLPGADALEEISAELQRLFA